METCLWHWSCISLHSICSIQTKIHKWMAQNACMKKTPHNIIILMHVTRLYWLSNWSVMTRWKTNNAQELSGLSCKYWRGTSTKQKSNTLHRELLYLLSLCLFIQINIPGGNILLNTIIPSCTIVNEDIYNMADCLRIITLPFHTFALYYTDTYQFKKFLLFSF